MSDLTTRIWDLYQKGVDHHNKVGMYTKTEKFHNFYLGDQWHGVKSGMRISRFLILSSLSVSIRFR